MTGGEWIALCGLGLVLLGQLYTFWRHASLRADDKSAAAVLRAGDEATGAAALKSLIEQLERLTVALDKFSDKYDHHETICDAFRARIETIIEGIQKTMEAMRLSLENQQRQITNIALGLAPTEAVELPAIRRRGKP